jgi:hypothetical protein
MNAKENPRIKKLAAEKEAEANGEWTPPPFPVASLPPIARKMACEVARVLRVPVAMTAPIILAVVSACIGKKLRAVTLRGRVTPANLYIVLCKESGTGGSSAFQAVTAPFNGLQTHILKRFRAEVLPDLEGQTKALNAETEASCRVLKDPKATDEGKQKARETIKANHIKLQAVEDEKRLPLLITGDATPEAIIQALSSNGECIAQFNPDGSDALASMLGAYRDRNARDGSNAPWLKSFSLETIVTSRTNKGTTIVEEPCLALLLVITPNTARKLLENDDLREDGLLNRIHFCDPHATMDVGTFEEETEKPHLDSEISQTWEAAVWKLCKLYRRPRVFCDDFPDGEEDDADDATHFRLTIESDGLRLLWEHSARAAKRWSEEDTDRPLVARVNEQVVRIAVNLHAVKHLTGYRKSDGDGKWGARGKPHEHDIARETIADAIAIVDWFEAHKLAMLQNQREAVKDKAFAHFCRLYAEQQWHRKGVKPRDFAARRIGGVRSSDGALRLLHEWESQGRVRSQREKWKGSGRKPSQPAFFLVSAARGG